MARNPFPIRWGVGQRPEVSRYVLKSGETFDYGELVKLTSGEIEVCGADPAVVKGIACDPAADVVEEGYINVYDADQIITYQIQTQATNYVEATHRGGSYGVVKVSGVWYLDLTETTTKVFTVVGGVVGDTIFYVKFHADALT